MARRLLKAADHQYGSIDSLTRQIRDWEAGKHFPRDWSTAYARAFAMAEEELFKRDSSAQVFEETVREHAFLGDDASMVDLLGLAWMSGRLDQHLDLHAVVQLAATLAESPSLGVVDPAERIAHALTRPTGLTDDMVEHLEARSIGFHRLECVLPASQIFRGLLAHLNEITSLLEICSTDRLRKRLARTAGETAVLGAWLAWDLGHVARAASLYRTAELAAQASDDPSIIACSMTYQSFAASGSGAYLEARRKLVNARELLPESGDGDLATRAWALGREAEEAAALADPSARDMIEEASDMLSSAHPQRERPWTRCLESPRLTHMRLTIATRLGDEART